MESAKPLLTMRGINKYFPENGVHANSNVDFNIYSGEIHSLIGENGTGKTTLMNILSGTIQPEKGEIILNGRIIAIKTPADALSAGIGMIHQHLQLIPDLSVWENIVLGAEPITKTGAIDKKSAIKKIQSICSLYGFKLNLFSKLSALSASERQHTALLVMLLLDIKILILDEPTSTFTDQEITLLFKIFKELSSNGKAIVFITHKLREVLHISDRITIMRNGRNIGEKLKNDTDEAALAGLMIGDEPVRKTYLERIKPGKVILEIRNLTCRIKEKELISEINFNVHMGETVAVTGIRENGLEILEDILSGMKKSTSGSVFFQGKNITNISPHLLRKNNIAFIPTDRMLRGASLSSTMAENLILLNYKKLHKWGLMKRDEIDHFTEKLRSHYNINGDANLPLTGLSGGNIQKVIVSRELSQQAGLVIFSEPAWGLDIRSRDFIYEKIIELKKKGTAILLISSDLDEVLNLADRVAVMYKGGLQAILKNKNLSRKDTGDYMLGIKKQKKFSA